MLVSMPSRPPARAASPALGAAALAVLALISGCGSEPGAAPAPQGSSVSTEPAASRSVTPSADPSRAVLACVAALPLEVRIGQTMVVTTTDLDRVDGWLRDGLIAGLLANGRLDASSARALERVTSGTRYGALLAADEEGGQVQRYRDVVGPIPSARRQAATMTPAEVRSMWAEHARSLADWGVDLVFAPVVDVGHGPGIGDRAPSDDPDVVAEFGAAAAQGVADAGLLPVLKHFPGHGRTTGDTHDGRSVGPSIEDLREVDLMPYREIPRQVEVGVMVGHTTIPGYSDTPSSQTKSVVTGLLGQEVGFDGLVVSDALGMAAAGQPTQGDALVGFLAAGGDLGIVGPGGSVEGRRAVRAALESGALAPDRLNGAAARVLAVKGVDPCAVGGGPAPTVSEADVPSDAPVINPTEQP